MRNKQPENLAYLASSVDNQNVTRNNLAQNLAQILLNLAQSCLILLQCSTLMQRATIRRQPLHVLNVNKVEFEQDFEQDFGF